MYGAKTHNTVPLDFNHKISFIRIVEEWKFLMAAQAVFNLRTIKDAFTVLCGKDPNSGQKVRSIKIDTLAAALHFLEVGACALCCTYDPTVPDHAEFERLGAELAKRSGEGAAFSLKKLAVGTAPLVKQYCVAGIEEATPLLLPFTITPEKIASDTYHLPWQADSPEKTITEWRRHLSNRDAAQACAELMEVVFDAKNQFYGSKCLLGVLGAPDPTLANRLKSLIQATDDKFLLNHLIPFMIERFRLHFLPILAANQPVITVPFFEPRLAPLCVEHAQFVAGFLAREAGPTVEDSARRNVEQFRLVFEAAPVALLALLTAPDDNKPPDSRRLFRDVIHIREQIQKVLDPCNFVAGQLLNELDSDSGKLLDEWVRSRLPASEAIVPDYCKVVKWAIPLVFSGASAVTGGAIGAVAGAVASIPAGYWLSEIINPNREHNIAVRNFTAIEGHWQMIMRSKDYTGLLRAKVRSHLGLELVV